MYAPAFIDQLEIIGSTGLDMNRSSRPYKKKWGKIWMSIDYPVVSGPTGKYND